MEQYLVNGHYITIKSSSFLGTQSKEEYEQQIISALHKIGVTQKYIIIDILKNGVRVNWEINKQQFSFTCTSQKSITLNMGAIAQAIQEDIRQIKRGIKDLTLVMKQYELEKGEITSQEKGGLLQFESQEEELLREDEEEVVFYSKSDARLLINNIKSRYKNFTDLSLIPEEERNKLRKAYLYLGVEVKF